MSRGVSEPTEGVAPAVEPAIAPAPSGAAVIGGRVKNYALLLKPRVMSLVVFTGLGGLVLAPGSIDPLVGWITVLCIAVGAGASGAINMWYDRDIDVHMERTKGRPLPAGRLRPMEALWLGVVLSVVSVGAMAAWVNAISAALLAITIAYYVFLYTMWLKRRTPLNIVIGGASGAFPPVIGWAAVTGSIDPGAMVLFMIIFLWTPPHFWSLALFRAGDYAAAGVPMLPVVAGVRETKKQIIVYTVLTAPVAVLPSFIGMASPYYGIAAAVLGAWFLVHARRVWRDDTTRAPRAMFFYSILYLFLVFVFLLADKGLAALL